MKFSLVIPVAPERGAPIIESLREIDYPKSEFHAIVVKGENPSENRNKGSEKARGEIIGFLDDDATVDPNILKNVEKFFEKHPEIDIVGGPQLTPFDDIGFAKISGYALGSKFGCWKASNRYGGGKENLNVDESALTSANLFVKKEVTERLKFDPRLFPGEDPKFIADAKKLGFRVAYSPDILIFHKRRPTIKGFTKQIFNYGWTRPTKESFLTTLKMPFFLIPLLFVLYLVGLLGIVTKNVIITGDIIGANNQLNLLNLLLIAPLFLYILLSLIFSIADSSKNKDYKAVLFLPFIYLLVHLSYGIGMIYGYLKKFGKLGR